MSCLLATLVPVRNGEKYLERYLECVSSFSDLVIALDDGSTDNTRQILRDSSAVTTTLDNPMRHTYSEWNDAENRQRLLDASARFAPVWIFWLDVDELVDESEGTALRDFLGSISNESVAYGMRVFRMIGDEQHYDKDGLWVYRVFRYVAGARLKQVRLHDEPIPIEIPKSGWIKTSFRIKHLSSMTRRRRVSRFRKYEEADPKNDYQSSYSNLLDEPKSVMKWSCRNKADPVLWEDTNSTFLLAQRARVKNV